MVVEWCGSGVYRNSDGESGVGMVVDVRFYFTQAASHPPSLSS